MKAFVIHTAGNAQSKKLAAACVASISKFKGWEPVLFAGATPGNLGDEARIPTMRKSRAEGFFNLDRATFGVKRACSINHYRLFTVCVALREPIAVVEHDSLCVRPPPDQPWTDVLVLNAQAAVNRVALKNYPCYRKQLSGEGVSQLDIGLHSIFQSANGAHIMPGTAAYAVTPAGAKKMLAAYDTHGWEQSDFMINSNFVSLEKYLPQCFEFGHEGLGTYAP